MMEGTVRTPTHATAAHRRLANLQALHDTLVSTLARPLDPATARLLQANLRDLEPQIHAAQLVLDARILLDSLT